MGAVFVQDGYGAAFGAPPGGGGGSPAQGVPATPTTTNTRYIRAGASGAGTGLNWTDAYNGIPGSLTRDTKYYIADGSYGSYTFNTAVSGTQYIVFVKATSSDHGTETGWSSTYGDGQAVFDTMNVKSDYWFFTGSGRNESSWNTVSAYGCWANQFRSSTTDGGNNGSNVTVVYFDMGATYDENPSNGTISGYQESVYLLGTVSNWTFSHCCMHSATGTMVQLVGVDAITFQYSWLGPSWGKEAIRGGLGSTTNCIIRHNTFYNSTQTDPNDGTSGITAEIAIWSSNTGEMDGNEVYGNIFYNTKSGGRNSCVHMGGDNGVTWVGGSVSNCKVYNNTFAAFPESSVFGNVHLLGGSGNVARNNLFYDTGDASVSANTTSNNVDAASSPFVNYAGLDFHITSSNDARNAGTSMVSPYNVDRDGTTFDSVPDVGAYQYA